MNPIDFTVPSAATFPERWIHGGASSRHNHDPEIQVHEANAHTFILRQSKAICPEATFHYLFFGNDQALLLDTGTLGDPAVFPLRAIVDELLQRWAQKHQRAEPELVVAHTHAHADHIGADAQFLGRPRTQVVPVSLTAVIDFIKIDPWPEGRGQVDLGGRQLIVIPAPGHEDSEISVFDAHSGLLVTGDIFYPGRLYVKNWDEFRASIARLHEFAQTHPVKHLVGCHIEMSRVPGRDYPAGTMFQPDEPPLQMTVEQLRICHEACQEIGGKPGFWIENDFIIIVGAPWLMRPHPAVFQQFPAIRPTAHRSGKPTAPLDDPLLAWLAASPDHRIFRALVEDVVQPEALETESLSLCAPKDCAFDLFVPEALDAFLAPENSEWRRRFVGQLILRGKPFVSGRHGQIPTLEGGLRHWRQNVWKRSLDSTEVVGEILLSPDRRVYLFDEIPPPALPSQ